MIVLGQLQNSDILGLIFLILTSKIFVQNKLENLFMGRKFFSFFERVNVVGFLVIINILIMCKKKSSLIRTSNAAETKQSAVFHFKTLENATLLSTSEIAKEML